LRSLLAVPRFPIATGAELAVRSAVCRIVAVRAAFQTFQIPKLPGCRLHSSSARESLCEPTQLPSSRSDGQPIETSHRVWRPASSPNIEELRLNRSPQGLKPFDKRDLFGTAEAVPLQNCEHFFEKLAVHDPSVASHKFAEY